jgi:hypothetical protein
MPAKSDQPTEPDKPAERGLTATIVRLFDPRPDDDRSSAAGGQRDYRRHLTAP